MASRLDGKVAVVTGASSGIGRAIAQELAREGAAVVGFARSFKPVTPDVFEGSVSEVNLDVTRQPSVDEAFKAIGGVDILVHAAGVAHFAHAEDLSSEQLREMLDVHVVGSANCTRAALPALRARAGHIVFVGSIATRVDFAECTGYAAAKYAQLGFARALAAEERSRGVHVMTAIVGATATGLWHGREGFDTDKMARPDDVASVIAQLVSDRAVVVDEIVITPQQGTISKKSSAG